jgi:hypothetical protein
MRLSPPLVAVLLALAACGGAASSGGSSSTGGSSSPVSCNDAHNSSMCPGDDCLACHGFQAAGTLFTDAGSAAVVGSASVTFVDKNGVTVSRTSNSAGNFYTSTALSFPLQRVTVTKGATTVEMLSVPDGHCNGCHEAGSRIHLP